MAQGLSVRFTRLEGVTDNKVLVERVPDVTGRIVTGRDKPLYLQCTLDDFTITEDAPWEDFDTVGDGQYSRPPSGRSLQVVNFASLAIDGDAPWIVDDAAGSKDEIRRTLRSLERSNSPFGLLVRNRTTGEVVLGGGEANPFMGTLRQLGRTIKVGEGGDLYLDIQITEWRDGRVIRSSHGGGGKRKLPTVAFLTATDTLMSLAKVYYGSSSQAWRSIANENGITNWGPSTPIVFAALWRIGAPIRIPKRGSATGSNKRIKR